ncbi:alpha/beta hydrolase family protein [Plantibacter sp. YIM 135347]|uniref:alpha/beta hydrolase family protein n=1 Tax=Plantibacter sp. YIM 135347 TaxID=3423919 RepID=UPI003D33433E
MTGTAGADASPGPASRIVPGCWDADAGRWTGRERISVPMNHDPAVPTPLVLYLHGHGGDVFTPFTGRAKNFETACVAAGWLFAAADGHSPSHFGAQPAIDAYLHLVATAREAFAIDRIVIMGESMGGLASLTILGRRLVPEVVAYVGVYPLTSVAEASATSEEWAAQIRASYDIAPDGSDAAVRTDGHSPVLAPLESFRDVPFLFFASPEDTVVSASANTHAFAARIAPVAGCVEVVATAGEHGDASTFTADRQDDLLRFLGAARRLPATRTRPATVG